MWHFARAPRSSPWPPQPERGCTRGPRSTCAGNSIRCPTRIPRTVKHGGSYFEDIDWWTQPAPLQPAGRTPGHGARNALPEGAPRVQPEALVPLVPLSLRAVPLIAGTCGLVFVAAVSRASAAPALDGGTSGDRSSNGSIRCPGLLGWRWPSSAPWASCTRRLTDPDLKTYTTAGTSSTCSSSSSPSWRPGGRDLSLQVARRPERGRPSSGAS